MRQRLVESPDEANAGDEFGTPLFWAVRNGFLEEIRELLSRGSSINASLALHVASQQRSPTHVEIARILLSQTETDLNARDADGRTPLHVSCITGNREVAQLLITQSADINAQDKYGETPLHLSARNGRTDLVTLLLAQPAIKVNIVEKEERIPLHWVFTPFTQPPRNSLVLKFHAYSFLFFAMFLLFSQSAINCHFGIAHAHADTSITQNTNSRMFLVTDISKMRQSAINGHFEISKILLEHGSHVDKQHTFGRTPLFYATKNNHKDVVTLLIAHGMCTHKQLT